MTVKDLASIQSLENFEFYFLTSNSKLKMCPPLELMDKESFYSWNIVEFKKGRSSIKVVIKRS